MTANERMAPRTRVFALLTLVALCVVSFGVRADRADAQQPSQAQGLVVLESTQSFEDTWSSLMDALDANTAIRVISKVDHGAAATTAGLSLEANRVVFFGNPALGTPIMQASRSAGIDLPQKMQVFESAGRVYVSYNPPSYLQARHSTGSVGTLARIDAALIALAQAATNSEVTPGGASSVGTAAGLVATASPNDFETTWAQLTNAIEASPANIAFTVDHGVNSAGSLAPTRLVVFGNPAIGTPIMASAPTAGVDLPLKMLVYEDDDGVTQVVSTAPAFVQQRHGVGDVATIGGATNAIANFTAAAVAASDSADNDDAASDDTDSAASDDAASDDETPEDEVLGTNQLAFTGSETTAAELALGLLGVGSVLLGFARRSRREH